MRWAIGALLRELTDVPIGVSSQPNMCFGIDELVLAIHLTTGPTKTVDLLLGR